jgi:hypothetical protein
MIDRDERLPFPSFDRGKNELNAFWRARGWINNHAEARSEVRAKAHRLSPHEGWIGFLKRHSYELIVHYICHGDVRTFELAVRHEGRPLPAQVRIDENPFHYGLLALFPSGDDEMITRQDRSAFGLQMLYAYRHRVPSRLLVGFLYQSGSLPQIRDRLKSGYVEEGFADTYDVDIWAGAKRKPKVAKASAPYDDEPSADDEVDLGGDDDLGVETG